MPVSVISDALSSPATSQPESSQLTSAPKTFPSGSRSHQRRPSTENFELSSLPRTDFALSPELNSSQVRAERGSRVPRPSDSPGNDQFPSDQSDASRSETSENGPMAKKRKSARPEQADLDNLASRNSHNGDVDVVSPARNGMIEHRRKHNSIDSTTSASQIAHLISRESFSLDDDVPQTPRDESGSLKGFWELPVRDRNNFSMLVLLYFLQGIPMGLAGGSVPFLLKSHLSYGQIGIFSLASYPYSLKLIWSPIVDAVWNKNVGRRKSWILPIQTLSGIGMIWLGGNIEGMMTVAGADGGAGVWGFTWWWFFLVFMCATQDIAVDG